MRLFLSLFVLTAFLSCQNEKKEESINKQSEIIVPEKRLPKLPKLPKNENENTKLELENEIFKVINAFKTKDEKTLNSYIDANVGFYLIPGPGTLLNFVTMDKISFDNAHISYHKFGDESIQRYKPIYENPPTYDCETYKWSKEGLFIDNEKITIFTYIVENPLNNEYDISFTKDEIAKIKQMEKISKLVHLAEKEGDIVFGIAKHNGKYIITFLNFSQSYCDV
ncbi:hypothetical protein AXA65_14770 [Chryseobacterium sp. FP211-J200]|nr:hypothetical protein AXA65_14770 [Chryseobacterium sp. FP211-J200]